LTYETAFLILSSQKSGSFRGIDDDTGRPIIVTIGENNDLTTVMTFEKGFYDRRGKVTGYITGLLFAGGLEKGSGFLHGNRESSMIRRK